MRGGDVADSDGTTPLYAAAVSGAADLVRDLLEAGADPNRESAGPSDGTPLCAAACWGHEDAAAALLSHGADPNRREEPGTAPLDWAVSGMHVETARLLLAAGADPNRDGPRGLPLIAAAERGSLALVGVLLEHGADPGSTDADGRSAADIADAWAGKDVETELRGELQALKDSEGRIDVRRTPLSDGTEQIEVSLAREDQSRLTTARETGHARIAVLLRHT